MTFLNNPGFCELYYEEGLTKYYIAEWGLVKIRVHQIDIPAAVPDPPIFCILSESDFFLCYNDFFLKLRIRPFFGSSLRGLPCALSAEPVLVFIIELNVINKPVVFRGGTFVEVKRFVCYNEKTLPFFC